MNSSKYNQGFTLIEMIVVIAIFIIFATIIVADYNKFGQKEKFINFIYDTALTIRQVQTSGFAVRESGEGSENFKDGYGLHFSPVDDAHGYTLFIDKPDQDGFYNKFYDASVPSGDQLDEFLRTIDIGEKYTIEKVCVFPTGDNCADENGNSVDVVFVRPNPDAYITYNGTGGGTYDSAKIYLRDDSVIPAGPSRIIHIDATGQISIQ
ncbi:MAG: prepilin-type N-terminal cleavage/methylation domain-containing protein [bacterium]|nr:prepilin-type N-terminal cleavage/methylation domain-containing protein [bacterium]